MNFISFIKRLFGKKPKLEIVAPSDVYPLMVEALRLAQAKLTAYYNRTIALTEGTLEYQEHHTPLHQNGDWFIIGEDGLKRSFWATNSSKRGIVHAAVGPQGQRSKSFGIPILAHETGHVLILRHNLIDGFNYAEQHRALKAAGLGFPWE